MKQAAAGRQATPIARSPPCTTTEDALRALQDLQQRRRENGVVQDKLWLPGLVKFKRLQGDRASSGEILSVRGEFGYWVFDGPCTSPAQRPTWNYRKEDGGGIIVDMLVPLALRDRQSLRRGEDGLVSSPPRIPERAMSRASPTSARADDSAYATFEAGKRRDLPISIASWNVRVRRDDLSYHAGGRHEGHRHGRPARRAGSSTTATRRSPCGIPTSSSPSISSMAGRRCRSRKTYDNAFKIQWELFLRHVVLDEPFRWTLLEGAKGVQLAEVGLKSSDERRRLDLPELSA